MGKAVDFVGGPSHRCRATRKARFLKLLRAAGGRADHSRDEAGHRIALIARKAMHGAPGLAGNFPAFALDRRADVLTDGGVALPGCRSEEHTSELQSLMRISYAGFCLKKKTQKDENEYRLKHNKTSSKHKK